jgi:hypothetical protein
MILKFFALLVVVAEAPTMVGAQVLEDIEAQLH